MVRTLLLWLLILASCHLQAQTQTRLRSIRAVGEGVVAIVPDQAQVDFTVVTNAGNAQEASTQNATLLAAVLARLRQALGANADIKTIDYSLTPNYNYPRDGSQPLLMGYSATNTLEVTSSDLANIGAVIDAGIQAGANRVQSLRFGLKDEQAARGQALKLAAQRARAQVDAIASGLGVRIGAMVSAVEGVSVQPMAGSNSAVAVAATPVVPGTLSVRATVTLEMEAVQ